MSNNISRNKQIFSIQKPNNNVNADISSSSLSNFGSSPTSPGSTNCALFVSC